MSSVARFSAAKPNRAPGDPTTSAVRLFMLGDRNHLLRLPAARYVRMLRQPLEHPLESFANRRVRCAEAVVELQSRKPVRVVRILFWSVDFDERGVLDTESLGRQSVAALDALLQELWPSDQHSVNIVDATARFVANGGSWTPTAAQRAELTKAALGEKKCSVVGR